MPECPLPLLGRDLLSKLEAQITFKNGETELLIPESKAVEARVFMLQDSPKQKQIPEEVENAVTPLVWANEVPGQSKLAEPVKVTLKPGSKPVRQKQYPLKWETREGLERLITKILQYGLLVKCESEYNTPILPVRKSGGKEYRLVQDLRAINQIVQDIHIVVANPYTLLTSLKEEHKLFTVLDLKDAFFCTPLDIQSQSIFAFEWESLATGWPKCQKSFRELKKALIMALALGLPDLTKTLKLFVHERQHLALGVLAQRLGSWKRPVGYFSKQLDNVSKGWPGCLRAVAATVLLIQEA